MPFRMVLFQFYQIVVKYYLKTLLRSLKVATLAADNARLSIILIQTLFLIKERYFRFFLLPLRFKLSFKLFVFYFYRIFHILSFLFFTHINNEFISLDQPDNRLAPGQKYYLEYSGQKSRIYDDHSIESKDLLFLLLCYRLIFD